MPKPPKPVSVLRAEGRAHFTKAQLEQRERSEAALLSGESMRELPSTRENPVAHRLFVRLRGLLEAIGKNDAMYENITNRYCLMTAEIAKIEADRERIDALLPFVKPEHRAKWMRHRKQLDALIGTVRRLLFGHEKELLLTVAASAQAVPKRKMERLEISGMEELLSRRDHPRSD